MKASNAFCTARFLGVALVFAGTLMTCTTIAETNSVQPTADEADLDEQFFNFLLEFGEDEEWLDPLEIESWQHSESARQKSLPRDNRGEDSKGDAEQHLKSVQTTVVQPTDHEAVEDQPEKHSMKTNNAVTNDGELDENDAN